jgi:hypothetical protein
MHAPPPRVRHDGDGRSEGSSGAFTRPNTSDMAAVVALFAVLEQRPTSLGGTDIALAECCEAVVEQRSGRKFLVRRARAI